MEAPTPVSGDHQGPPGVHTVTRASPGEAEVVGRGTGVEAAGSRLQGHCRACTELSPVWACVWGRGPAPVRLRARPE